MRHAGIPLHPKAFFLHERWDLFRKHCGTILKDSPPD